jgi:hypothetical protein
MIMWAKEKLAERKLYNYSLKDIRKDQLRKEENITFNALYQWTWYFIENQKEASEKLKEECRIIYGILNMDDYKKDWKKEFISHIGKIIATNRNGKHRKGKYKRIIRSHEYQTKINSIGEDKIMKNYREHTAERRETERRIREEDEYFWEQERKENYFKRRKSEPSIKIPQI